MILINKNNKAQYMSNVCETCGKQFSVKSSLTQHKKRKTPCSMSVVEVASALAMLFATDKLPLYIQYSAKGRILKYNRKAGTQCLRALWHFARRGCKCVIQ